MSTPAERAEILAELELVTVKRLGSNRVHAALVHPDSRVAGSVFGAACTFIASPIVTFCKRTLRGRVIEIPDVSLESWKRNGHLCVECQLVAAIAVAQAERRPE